jgi:hypothetical protein
LAWFFRKEYQSRRLKTFFERFAMLANRFCRTIAECNPIMLLVLIVLVSLGSAVPTRSQMLQLSPTYDKENKVYRLFTDDNKSFAPVPMCDDLSQNIAMPNRLIVQQLKMYGVMDLLGNVIAPFMYDEIRFCRNIECFAVVQRKKWALMGKNGELKTDIRFDAMYYWLTSNVGFILVQEEGKWGLIDSSGKEVIPLQYSNCSVTRHPEAGVWLCKETAEGVRWGKMLPNGTVLKPFVYDSVEVVDFPNRSDVQNRDVQLDGEYIVAERDGKWGIEAYLAGSSVASVVVPFQYQKIETYDSDQYLFSAQKSVAEGSAWGMIKISSRPARENASLEHSTTVAIPFAYTAPFENCYYAPKTMIGAKKETGWGIVDSTGKQMLAFLFDERGQCVAPNRYQVKLRGVTVIADSIGKIITPAGYDECEWLTTRQISTSGTLESVAIIKSRRGKYYGLLSSTGTVLMEPIADNALFFNGGLAYIHKPKELLGGYINTKGIILTDFVYGQPEWLEVFYPSVFLRRVFIGSHFGVINNEGKELVPVEYERVWIFDGGKTFFAKQTPEKGSKWSYFAHTGKPFCTDKYDSVMGYTQNQTLVRRNGKWGILCDTTAQELVPPTYDSVAVGYRSPVMRAWRGSMVCLVGTSTQREITPFYDFVERKYIGAIRVRRGGKWGVVSADSLTLGQEIVPPRYDYICEAQNGFAQVRMGTKYGYVALKGADAGKEVVPPSYDIAAPANENGQAVALKGGVELRLQLPMPKNEPVSGAHNP